MNHQSLSGGNFEGFHYNTTSEAIGLIGFLLSSLHPQRRTLIGTVNMINSQTLVYIATNPWIFLIASRPLFAYGAGFTLPKSTQRYIALALLILYSATVLSNFTRYIQSTGYWASIFAGAIFSFPLTYFDRLILRRWTFEDRQAIFSTAPAVKGTVATPEENSFGSRFAFGNEVMGTVRGPGTSWEVKGVPNFSNSDPDWVPSPFVFILWKMAVVAGCFLVNDYVIDMRFALDKNLCQESRVPFFTRLGTVSRQELWTRLMVNFTFWMSGYCILQVFFGIPAIMGACLNPTSIREWRPAFGSIFDAYTIRNFWGKFWHQNLQMNVRGPARFITHEVLHLPRQGLFQRYTFIFFVFFISGCLHIASDMGASIRSSESGALRFFSTQALGIMLEDGAQDVYRRAGGKPGLVPRIAGYIWVLTFLSWSIASWQYPAMLVTRKEDVVFNLSAFRSLGPPRQQ